MPTERESQALYAPDLRLQLQDAQEQLHAMGEVLSALGRSESDLDDVFRTVVLSAQRLCRGDAAQLHLFERGTYRLAWYSGLTDEFRDFMAEHPPLADRATLIGRVGLDRRTQQIPDVLADPDYGRADAQRLGNYRSIIGAPMLLDGEVVGVLSAWRNRVAPFSDRAAELLTNFATQAAIAVRTAGLVRELEQRSGELATKVDQMEALGAIGAAVSSSLDLDEVLSAIVTHAVALSGTDGGSILEFVPELMEFRVRTAFGTSPEVLEALRGIRLGLHDTLVGRAARERRPLQVPDLADGADDAHLQTLRDAGWRSLVAVPLLRPDRIVGALVVRRRKPGVVDAETCEFLQTFASQSTLAIGNAQLYRRLEQQSAELAVVSQHKSEFLASMSHELRTPLNAIIGFSEVLLERMFGEINERQDEYLNDIHASGKHLLALLNDILDLSKVEAGQMVLDFTDVNVRHVLQSCVGLVRERAVRKGLTLDVGLDADVETVEADELRLRQVVLNVLTNAVKFTPPGGSVTVHAHRSGTGVAVSVTDTGVGVPREDGERIFESFQQGGRSPSAQEGTGLGLTLSRRIVELHGGRLSMVSEVGKGSTFTFTIPATVRSEPTNERADGTEDSPFVLVIEDDRRSLELLSILLEDQDLRVRSATTGEQALSQLDGALPLAVILDIRLPGIDGWEVLSRIKGDPSTAHLPVIVVSMLDERGRAVTLGADDYIVKPVTRAPLVAALRRASLLPEGRDRSVLVIDADNREVEAITTELMPAGWIVSSVSTVGEAVADLDRHLPDVILLDLVTAASEGFELLDLLRRESTDGPVPVVALAPADADEQQCKHLIDRLSVAACVGDVRFDDLPARLDRAVSRGPCGSGGRDGG